MTPKEKALQLANKFYRGNVLNKTEENHFFELAEAKKSALIAVEEIIKETKLHDKTTYQHGRTAYWNEVKQELENL